MIDDGLGFQLVPWRPALEQQLGRQVTELCLTPAGLIGIAHHLFRVGLDVEGGHSKTEYESRWNCGRWLLRVFRPPGDAGQWLPGCRRGAVGDLNDRRGPSGLGFCR
jgi:hypothetical protein